MWEAMSLAGWVLAHTTSLVAGHLVLCDSFRQPAVLAKQVSSLDNASGGRFELGIGWGSMPVELQAYGVSTAEPRERVERLDESLTVMKALWSGEPVDFTGKHFTLTGAQQRPTPTRPIPITVGGIGPRTLAVVHTHADWWNVPVYGIPRIPKLRDQAGNARISVQQVVALVTSESERADVTALVERRYGGTPMHEHSAIGTANELVDHFGHLHEQGVDRFYPWFADFAPVETLHRFADVIDGMFTR